LPLNLLKPVLSQMKALDDLIKGFEVIQIAWNWDKRPQFGSVLWFCD
jgi:hypothetical protein